MFGLLLINSAFSEEFHNYVVKKGDSLGFISTDFYGTQLCWPEIAKVNGSDKLEVGQTLKLPKQITCGLKIKKEYVLGVDGDSVKRKVITNKSQSVEPASDDGVWRFSTSIAPIQYSKVDKGTDISVNASAEYEKDIRELKFFYEFNKFSTTDPLNKIRVKSSNQEGLIAYDWNNIWGDFTYFMLGTYANQSAGDVNLIEHRIRGGVIGIKYDFYKGKTVKDISLSLIPLYEYLHENVESGTLVNTIYSKNVTSFLRLSFRFRVKILFEDGKYQIKNTAYFRPAYDFDKSIMEWNNNDIENTLKFTINISNLVAFSYDNKFTYDKRRKDVYKIPTTDLVNTFYIDLNF